MNDAILQLAIISTECGMKQYARSKTLLNENTQTLFYERYNNGQKDILGHNSKVLTSHVD